MDDLWQQFDDEYSQQQEEDDDALIAIVGMAILGRPGHMRQVQTYLTRQDLPQNPRLDSAWAFMRNGQNYRAYITTMGLDVQTFELVLAQFQIEWDNKIISRDDFNPNGKPQLLRRSLDATGVLGLVLHWISSTIADYTLQQIFALTPAVCPRYIRAGLNHLLAVLNSMPLARICWLSRVEPGSASTQELLDQKHATFKHLHSTLDTQPMRARHFFEDQKHSCIRRIKLSSKQDSRA